MDGSPVVAVEGVSKKYCRRLKHSLWYGVQDLVAELTAQSGSRDLQLRDAEFLAVNDVSFELRRGECVGLIGHNGAGKSTLLKMLNGLARPDKGKITLHGRVGALIELGAGFSPVLTGRENVYINGAVLGCSKREIDSKFAAIVDFAELGDAIDAPVRTYSSGMYVRLGFAVATQLNPDILLVDEILAVGDVAFRMKCFQHFLDLKKAGRTIVVVSHNMIDLHRVCDRVIVMNGGKIHFDGDVSSGIAIYEELQAAQQTHLHERPATMAARIESVKLFNADGHPQDCFSTGADLVAEVNLAATQRVKNARLVVHVMTPSLGTLGAFATPSSGVEFDVVPPGTTIAFTLRSLPLLIGSYTLSVSLYGPLVTDFLDADLTAASFKITSPPVDAFGYGDCHIIRFNHEWQLSGRPKSAVPGPLAI